MNTLVRFALIVGLVLPSLAFANTGTQSVSIDSSKSSLAWTGKKVTGQHNGVVGIKSGTVKLENGIPTSGSFDIDMSSIAVKDIEDAKDNSKLTNHLKSEDFFAASVFPTAQFTLKSAAPIANAKLGDPNYTVTGTLSIKGLSHDISFPAIISVADGKAEARATVSVDRTLWNVRYGSGKFFQNLGDRLIKDNFDIELNLVGTVG